MCPAASCFACELISECSSARKESLKLPKALAAMSRDQQTYNQANLKPISCTPTGDEAIESVSFCNILDAPRKEVVRVDEVECSG